MEPSPNRSVNTISNNHYDYIIIGLGLSGTFLSYYLKKANKKVLVIDDDKPFTASKAASGVINPVTGRRIVRTWRIEELLPFASKAYKQMEKELEVKLITTCSVLDFHPTLQMKEAFEKRCLEEQEYLHEPDEARFKNDFQYYFGVGEIAPCLLVDVNALIETWRRKLVTEGVILTKAFSWDDCIVNNEGIVYKNFTAKKIIDCSGVSGANNPYFKNLPYAPNKGEAIIASIPGLKPEFIYKQGLSIVPWKDGLFWIGSSYEWSFTDSLPTANFKQKVTNQLKHWLKLPFEITDHFASVRPANIERRPFVGLHPQYKNIGILNGMGTKGCSLAPFFAKQFANHLLEGIPVYADADVKRFEKVLARKID